jgi:hypothetical protein
METAQAAHLVYLVGAPDREHRRRRSGGAEGADDCIGFKVVSPQARQRVLCPSVEQDGHTVGGFRLEHRRGHRAP